MGVISVSLLSIFAFLPIDSVPPEACFANFRWDDCGLAATPVMYYWKPGSRCEVGLWRGCLPNINMFQDEYECVTTCVFTERAMPEDYHLPDQTDIELDDDVTTETVTATDSDTEVTTLEYNATTVDVGDVTSEGNQTVDETGATSNDTATTAA